MNNDLVVFSKLGAVPKKLKLLNPVIREKLNNLCNDRIKYWKTHKLYQFPCSSPVYYNITHIGININLKVQPNGKIKLYIFQNEVKYEINDFDKNGNLVYSFKIIVSNIRCKKSWTTTCEHYNINTGKSTNNWFNSDQSSS